MTGDLFMPKKDDERDLLDPERAKSFIDDDIIVFGSGREIYALPDFVSDPVKITTRRYAVWALCFHNGKLYDAGAYDNIYETVEKKAIATRKAKVFALCSHEGDLYDGGAYNKVFNTLDDKLVLDRNVQVLSLSGHEGVLYAACSDLIFEVGASVVNKRDISIQALHSHDGILYDSAGSFVKESFTSRSVFTGPVTYGLCTHNGNLYNCVNGGKIYDTLDNTMVYSFNNSDMLNCMVSVPKKCLEGLV